jgi:hypothetical protein
MMTFERRLLIEREKKAGCILTFLFDSFREEIDQTIITMRTDTNELSVHSLLANDINRVRETGKTKKNVNL